MTDTKKEKTLTDYILLAKKEHRYRLKFAVDITEGMLIKIHNICEKYKVIELSKPIKTPIQSNPLDFKNVNNVEVTIIDLVSDYPASTEMLHQELHQGLGLADSFVVVRQENDPYEREIDTREKAEKEEYVVKLNDPDNKSDGEIEVDLYGDEYNSKLLSALSDDKKEKEKKKGKEPGSEVTVDKKDTPKAKDFNKAEPGTKSPLGDHKPKMPAVVKKPLSGKKED